MPHLASVALVDLVIAHHRARLKGPARRITINLDPTDDPTHGQQEFTFFNGHDDTWCYLPLVATLTFNTDLTPYLVAAVLRPGNSPATRGALGLLTRLVRRLRAAFPGAILRVRLDGGFASPEVLDFLDAAVEYVVALASHVRLVTRSRRLMGRARMLSKASAQTEHLYGETRYAARTWSRKWRVIIKVEVMQHPGRAPKNKPRVVLTNLAAPPERLYQLSCARGDMENRLKELHHGLAIDRTSCVRFTANHLRVLVTAAAYLLFQALQHHAQGTACADAQVSTLREQLFRLAALSPRPFGERVMIERFRLPVRTEPNRGQLSIRDPLGGVAAGRQGSPLHTVRAFTHKAG